MTLEGILNKVDDSRCLWMSPEISITAVELKHDISVCRKALPLDKRLRVAIELSNTITALTWMLALDGIAESVFLVPESLRRSDDYAGLMCLFKPNFVVSDTGIDEKDVFLGNDNFTDGLVSEKPFITRWVLATSGTTGMPKLIEHTTASLTKSCKVDIRKGQNYIWGLVYDPFRFAGLQVVLQALSSASQLVLCNRIKSISEQAAFLLKNRVNALSATPSYWRKLLMSGTLRGHDFRQITLGGEPADQSVLNALKSAFPLARVAHIYASTEAGVGFSVTDGLVGFPKEYLDEGIAGNNLCIGDTGTLLIKPERYIPKSTGGRKLANKDGFIDTGDLVEVKGERVLFLGRDSGAINVGGNKVIPEEVETIIREVDGVGEVLVKPKGSGVMGQLVTAEIQPLFTVVDKTALKKAVIAHCRERLEKYKVPALIRFVEEIEYNPTGKINRA